MKVYFTADTHFGHGNIITYTKRPFTSFQQMDECILDNFNSVLKKADVLYHLGDFSWSSVVVGDVLKKLNTKNVHLVMGNHDCHSVAYYQKLFQSVSRLRTVKWGGGHFTLCHYPLRSWASRGSGGIQLHGHCHGTLPPIGRQMDVGVDCHAFRPIEAEEIVARLKDVPVWDSEVKEEKHETH